MEECGPCLGENLRAVAERGVDVDAPPAARLDLGSHEQLGRDGYRAPVANEHSRCDGREAVPGSEQPARLVQCGRDETAVNDPRAALMLRVELEAGLVELEPLHLGLRQAQPERVLAATETRWVVVRRDPLAPVVAHRRPPRSWWALKNSCESAVAIAAEAEISSASAAAATICARR